VQQKRTGKAIIITVKRGRERGGEKLTVKKLSIKNKGLKDQDWSKNVKRESRMLAISMFLRV
jgi:hypothetical protein